MERSTGNLRLLTLTAVVIGICALPAQAKAATDCPSYLEQVVNPVTFDVLAAKVSKLPSKKDEFETTAQFESRVSDALNGQPETYIVSIPFDSEHVIYDADAQRLRVNSYAFDNATTKWNGVFGYGTPFDGQVKYSPLGNVDIVVSETKSLAGSYQGSNAFGVKMKVQKERRTTKAIFDREAKYGEDLFFAPGAPVGHSPVVLDFEATPELARKFKPKFRAALVISPKPPFHAVGKVEWGEPTIKRPLDIDETLIAVIADIQCALLTDETHRVAASITTR